MLSLSNTGRIVDLYRQEWSRWMGLLALSKSDFGLILKLQQIFQQVVFMKAIGLLLAFFITLQASPSYLVNDLGTLGSSSAIGFKINDSGTVVGWAETIYGYPQAFQSANGGPLQTLASLSASDSYAMGINSAGVIAGTAYVNGQPHGVIWNGVNWNGSTTTDLGAGIYATGINDPGVVVGGKGHAFVLTNGVCQDLGVLPGGNWSSAYGINNSGTVVGYSSLASGNFGAFVWTPQSGMQQLGTFGGLDSYATSLNNSGEVIGYASLSSGYDHAFSALGTVMTDLGTLGGSSFAYGINDSGEIVGYSWPVNGDNPHAFLYLNGIMVDLNSLIPTGSGWQLLEAYGINDTGQIVGEGLLNGQSHAFLLDPAIVHNTLGFTFAAAPVPEPGNAWLAALGFALVWTWGRRTKLQARRNP
jgi:probable HAF family extracellular repeat protein